MVALANDIDPSNRQPTIASTHERHSSKKLRTIRKCPIPLKLNIFKKNAETKCIKIGEKHGKELKSKKRDPIMDDRNEKGGILERTPQVLLNKWITI
jgi:hypothetical protein